MGNDTLKIVNHEDAAQAKRSSGRAGQAAPEGALDPSTWMEMLGDIDGLKREIQERMRRIEAVKQAKALLLEEAARTEELNRRLAEIGKTVSTVHAGLLESQTDTDPMEELRQGIREASPQLVVHEGVPLPWPKADAGRTAASLVRAAAASPEGPIPNLKIKPEVAEFVTAIQSQVLGILGDPDAKTQPTPGHAEALVEEARRLMEESSARLALAAQREEQATADLEAGRELLSKALAASADAKRLLEDATAQLAVAADKERQSAADFQAAQRALTAAYVGASQRLETAEQFAREGEGFASETRKLLARMERELAEARSGAKTATEDLQSARQELTTAYQFASVAAQRRLDSAEFYRKTASWVMFSTALAWMLAVWMVWVAFNRSISIAIPFLASCLILAAAVFLRRRGVRQLEEI